MKNIENMQGLWRDPMPKQCLYAGVVFATIFGIININLLQPKYQQIERLSKEMMKLSSHHQNKIEKNVSSCDWHKKENAWQITGSFASVYDCILNEPNQQPVASMMFQKNISGVSVMLHGMPA